MGPDSSAKTKDHIEKIDFQELIFAVVNWPNSELYGAFVCIILVLHWLVCYKPAGQSFPDFGVWVSVDFDSKYKIVWGETRDHQSWALALYFQVRSPLISFPWIAIALTLI